MIPPKDHPQERERLQSLDSFSILDTLPEEDYDNLTAIAAEICGTPISLVSLLDGKRQWFKSHHGLDVTETPKEYAFCAHAINCDDEVFIVQDARIDPRFKNNPLVLREPLVIFYAGVPLKDEKGLPLGTLCVIDHTPRLLSKSQVKSLRALARQVVNLLQLRRNNQLLTSSFQELEEKNCELEDFAHIAAHDLKSPLNNISGMAQLLKDYYKKSLDEEGNTIVNNILSASQKLREFIDGLLEYSKSDHVLGEERSWVAPGELVNDLRSLFSYENELEINLESQLDKIFVNKSALEQIMINLVANAVKYNDKELVQINLGISENQGHYEFYVQDNGPGISEKQLITIFQIFKVAAEKDKFGRTGNGIGLATVKKLVEKLNGTIEASSSEGKGCKFSFSLEREQWITSKI